ncbi:PAS domain S-box protein [Halobaculum sp. WSA2]|uniref:histidine kinase n=1 Tax=Halobaculum saliterrae TaxID=2073113 RepID=A0A6B0SU13_9EURY|nr:PAS domain S-box protein [Halobaculum saliterrae]MXR42344.1 PAS domain S-box protein [Halobaculum saliterrae]
MSDHAEQLVGTLFRVLSEEGHPEVRETLLRSYHSHATTDREELTDDLFSELITVLHERVDTATQVDVLGTAVGRLLDRFTTVIETAPVAILTVGRDGDVQVWNDGAERIFGWSDSEARRRPYDRLLAQSSERVEGLLDRLRDGERFHGVTVRCTHRDGRVLDVRVWGAPIRTGDGSFSGAVFVASDVSERKQREQRLAVLNRVLRHNVRNDVNVVRGHLEMLAEECPGGEEHVRVIDDRLSRMVELSETARKIERLRGEDAAERTTIDVAETLHERVERLRSDSCDARVRSDVPDSLPVVAHELLPHALDNVLDNAVEHNDSDVPVVEVTTNRDAERNHAVVSVVDDGPGLPATERKVLTSETETQLDHSSGVGLWLTRWIVRSSGGSIAVEESEYGGTRVSIRLRTGSG